jgi:alpha-glucoside transport system permease protein
MSNLPSFQDISEGGFLLNLFVDFPINTVLLMLVMVWMFTGFAMVVFSAAIKAIPAEIIEAGQIDGASESKIFISIVIPYLKATIVVVATYLTVSVLKAFDIIYVTTRGDFETNLLAVKMLDEFAKFLNQGRSAAVAVIIFISVIPVIILNVYRNRQEAKE